MFEPTLNASNFTLQQTVMRIKPKEAKVYTLRSRDKHRIVFPNDKFSLLSIIPEQPFFGRVMLMPSSPDFSNVTASPLP